MAASFPTSIKTFTTKTNDVDEIDAAHINDLQDEVNAIETELGTDPAGSFTTVKARLDAGEFHFSSPLEAFATDTTQRYRLPVGTNDIKIVNNVVATTYVLTTNDGSNYWTVTINVTSATMSGGTTIHTFNTSGDSPDTMTAHDDTPDSSTPSESAMIIVTATKTGSPGNLQISIGVAYQYA